MNNPAEIAEATLKVGDSKLNLMRRNPARLVVASIMAGAFIAFGGTLSLIVGFGFPEISAANPSMQKLLAGAMFPIGLILVVTLGAELFTGNNALLIPAFMRKNCGAGEVALNWTIVYLGNFVGAMLFTYFMVYYCGLTSSGPWHDAILGIVKSKTSMSWGVTFVKGIGANWCVCLAIWLALSSKSFTGKALGCWLPVMAFVALGYEHCIANMFYLPLGLLEGSEVGIGRCITANLIPATIGNIIGGGVFVGCVHTYLHLKKRDEITG